MSLIKQSSPPLHRLFLARRYATSSCWWLASYQASFADYIRGVGGFVPRHTVVVVVVGKTRARNSCLLRTMNCDKRLKSGKSRLKFLNKKKKKKNWELNLDEWWWKFVYSSSEPRFVRIIDETFPIPRTTTNLCNAFRIEIL